MPRIPRVRGLQSLQAALVASPSCTAPSIARTAALSTSARVHGKSTDWVRGKLWQGEAPGPKDPYTQRPEEVEDVSHLPAEVRERRSRADYIPTAVEKSRLVLPPLKRIEAASAKEIPSVAPEYTPATSIEELEEIPPLKNWWDQPGNWGPESDFYGFAAEKVEDKAVVELNLRRAVVETLALQETGLLNEWAAKKWPAGERAALDQALAVQLQVQDGKATLTGNVQALADQLTKKAEEVEETAKILEQTDKISAEEAQEIVKSWDASWKEVSLNDEYLKFAIRKRIYQLTGRLIPDSKLGAARTVQHLLTLTVKPAKRGKKLAEILQGLEELQTLPNVKVHSSKIGPIDKEVSVGRWKVIEEELTKRGLPVTGTGGLGKNKERDWLTGKR